MMIAKFRHYSFNSRTNQICSLVYSYNCTCHKDILTSPIIAAENLYPHGDAATERLRIKSDKFGSDRRSKFVYHDRVAIEVSTEYLRIGI